MTEAFIPPRRINPSEITVLEERRATSPTDPSPSDFASRVAMADAAGLLAQVRMLAELEPDMIESDPQMALLAKMKAEDLQYVSQEIKEIAPAMRESFNAFAVNWPELPAYWPPSSVSLFSDLYTDALHISGLTIPWRSTVNTIVTPDRRGLTWIEDRDYSAHVFFVIEARLPGMEEPFAQLIRRQDAGAVKLYSDGQDYTFTQVDGEFPGKLDPILHSDRHKSFPKEVAKGTFHRFTHIAGYDPLAVAKSGEVLSKDEIKAQRQQYVNDDDRSKGLKTLALLGNHIHEDLRYYLVDAFLVLEPIPTGSTKTPFVSRVAMSQIENKAKALAGKLADTVLKNLLGPVGGAASALGKAFINELTKELKANDAPVSSILTIPLNQRGLNGKAVSTNKIEIPIENETPHSKFDTPIGTTPELWAYGSGRNDVLFEQDESSVIAIGALKRAQKKMETHFDICPSVRLMIRRGKLEGSTPK
ncbi:hypothetical protein [uncultured Roseobacter sp.]|uniref:hypothetical protein n=1 Tax=uncultured Roseobacter sp. TaxID=114847 RepID=UPI002637CECA|nr:hypothetical protein [uncultured Roseobacter sp.]